MEKIRQIIETAFEDRASITPQNVTKEVKGALKEVLDQLDSGQLRVAQQFDSNSKKEWLVNEWLKKAVLLSFRIQDNFLMDGDIPSILTK